MYFLGESDLMGSVIWLVIACIFLAGVIGLIGLVIYIRRKINKYKNIWIGTFGNDRDQKDKSNIDIVETLLIRAYKEELGDNDKKKKMEPAESVCVVNLWYNIYEQVKHNRNLTISFMDDVIVYDGEVRRILKGRLSEVKGTF